MMTRRLSILTALAVVATATPSLAQLPGENPQTRW
jgi:hypothetical protein